jgi:hypothetical protein
MAYQTLANAQLYYELHGYAPIHTPWSVEESISNITKPENRSNFPIKNKVLVASGEQSFLQMIWDGELEPYKRYQTTTPCFRDEAEDALHKQYFMKNELIYSERYDQTSDQMNRLHIEVDRMAQQHCLKFFLKYLPGKVKLIPVSENENGNGVDSPLNSYLFDLVAGEGDGHEQFELGSYGIRQYGDNIWAFGTGCAEPRLTAIIDTFYKPGYHLDAIPKTCDLGSLDKIIEEYQEFIDAVKQKTHVMALVELSDLIGAIDLYTKANFNLSIDDLKLFSSITQRAFINGHRQ